MMSFQSMFEKSKGMPIRYQGKTLVMVDEFPTEGVTRLRLVFESCKGEWRQGVGLRIAGRFNLAGQAIDKGIVLWYDTAPQIVEFEVQPRVSAIEVKNVWDVGDGVIHSWHLVPRCLLSLRLMVADIIATTDSLTMTLTTSSSAWNGSARRTHCLLWLGMRRMDCSPTLSPSAIRVS